MMRPLVLALAFAAGAVGRSLPSTSFKLLFRAQLVLLSSTLALLTGWSISLSTTALAAMGVVLLGDVAALGLGRVLVSRGRLSPPAAASAACNSGFWSIPTAGALFGPAGAAFAVLYDVVSVPRAVLVVDTLRRGAPSAPSRASAAVDYLPQLSLVAGLLLRRHAPAPGLGLLPVLGLALGVAGFLLLGMAMPPARPRGSDWRAALGAVPLRFGVLTAACLAATAGGLRLPGAAWVLALAPSPFAVVSMSRLYGYRREEAAAIPLLTVPLALLLLPWAAWLAR